MKKKALAINASDWHQVLQGRKRQEKHEEGGESTMGIVEK